MGLFDAIKDAFTTDDQERHDYALKLLNKTKEELAQQEAKAQAGDKRAEKRVEELRAQIADQQKAVDDWAAKLKEAAPAAADAPAPAPAEAAPEAPAEAPKATFDNPLAAKQAASEPAPAPAEEPVAEAAPAAPAAPAEPLVAAGEYREYTVVKGDNLTKIGKKFDVKWRDIAELNDIKNPDLIYPGQVFKIPNA